MASETQPGLQITTRNDKTLPISLLQTLIKPFRPHLIKPKKQFPSGSPELSPHSKAKSKCHITQRKVSNIWIYDMASKTPVSSASKRKLHVFYFAGGGWQMPPSPEHWKLCTEMAMRLGCRVSIISYPLAPASPATDSIFALQNLYPHLFAEEEEEIVFAGDSAGGNVVLSLVLSVLEKTPLAPTPEKLVVICPAVDLRQQPQNDFSTILTQTDKKDPLLGIAFTNSTAGTWCQDMDSSSPLVSPLFANLSLLRDRGVKVFGMSAGNDVLAPPAYRFAEICREKGVQGEWLHWEGLMHCFPLAWVYGIREGKEGLEWILKALRE